VSLVAKEDDHEAFDAAPRRSPDEVEQTTHAPRVTARGVLGDHRCLGARAILDPRRALRTSNDDGIHASSSSLGVIHLAGAELEQLDLQIVEGRA